MRTNRTVHAAGLAALLAITLVGCSDAQADKSGGSQPADPVVLTFANNNGGLPPQLPAYAEEVAARSDGALRIEFVNDWREGEPDQEVGLIEDVRAGDVDMDGRGRGPSSRSA